MMVATVAVGLTGTRPVNADRAPAPRPLYNNHLPQKEDVRAAKDYIDLSGIPAAQSVGQANSTFDKRTAAAVLYSAIFGGFDDVSVFLSKMAFQDYFDAPIYGFLRNQVNQELLARGPGQVGTAIDFSKDIPILGTVELHEPGDYDVDITAYLCLYYKYYDVLTPKARDHVFYDLLTQTGLFDPYRLNRKTVDAGIATLIIPETENHVLMIESSRYLTNQLWYQLTHDQRYDNNRNSYPGDGNPPLTDWILQRLQAMLASDFVEYNSRNYQDYTMPALLNLASYSYDDRVRVAASMVLDYVSAKVAVSSNDLRRSAPFRRRNEEQHWGPMIKNGFLGSPLLVNAPRPGGGPFEPEPQIGFYAMLAGNTAMIQPPELKFNFKWEMVNAGLRDYRVPAPILDLFVNQSHRRFYQRFHHYAGSGQFMDELYAASPQYLISAGGVPTSYAYQLTVLPAFGGSIPVTGDDIDLGVALPTTFMNTLQGTSLYEHIQFGKLGTDAGATKHLGVAPDFACGDLGYLPAAYNAYSEATAPWIFVNRGSYYLAIYAFDYKADGADGFIGAGFLEALDTSIHPGVTFDGFKASVLSKNGATRFQYPGDNDYETYAGQRIRFHIGPGVGDIISTSAVADSNWKNKFASGDVINSEQGSALVVISNPATGAQITLDMRDWAHPCRTSESGERRCAGSIQTVWVNFNSPPNVPETGDFAFPFRSMAAAQDGVAEGGTVNIMPGSTREPMPIQLLKPMTIRAVSGPAVLGSPP